MSQKNIYILGVSMSNHDRAAALLKNGAICSAIAEERLDRRKKSDGFYASRPNNIVIPPLAAITYVLREEGIQLNDVDLLVCGRSIQSCKETILQYIPISEDKVVEAILPSHHLMHAYSAFGTSPFKESAVLVLDEQGHRLNNGKYEKISMYKGSDGALKKVSNTFGDSQSISLGMFFDIFSSLTGLSEAGVPSAGKLMGLAPFGKPQDDWKQLIEIKDGDVIIDIKKIDEFFEGVLPQYETNNVIVEKIDDFLEKYIPVHWNTPLAYNLAYKAQSELSKAIESLSLFLLKKTNCQYLCYAGGVALNCSANSKLKKQGWKDIYVHPAATDDGVAVGLCQYGWIELLEQPRKLIKFNPFLGKTYTNETVIQELKSTNLLKHSEKIDVVHTVSEYIAKGEIVCWFQGSSEWGPRALGSRSILANPLEKSITEKINKKVKFRERFRPFGISITEGDYEQISNFKDIPKSLSPYMLNVVPAKDILKEVRHVDGTIRFQEVCKSFQPLYYKLIKQVGRKTGLNAVLNTSFNVMGEPLVEKPDEAIRQFFLSGANVLVMGDICIDKSNIPINELERIENMFKKKSNINTLNFVLSLESANFENEADQLMKRYSPEKQSPLTKRKYHAFCLRQAIRKNDHEGIHLHIKELMTYISYPQEANIVISALRDYLPNSYNLAGLLTQVSNQYNAYEFFERLLLVSDKENKDGSYLLR
ncbi:carbamoyltransferase C-terminal domain-containing protein [Shouchella tritolerans]|uniref:carbamoyltransferase C-terminal domain-containing protein n=1 Tax=Shouchella tritolerans TaxID=2979466 RepID=UPI000788E551|nr:carbamoyltransferase C-terminal domain-containing protein [Shouchella tritolerans]